MQLKRTTRNAVCWLLAIALILLGSVKRAKRASFQDGVITSIYFHNPNKRLFRRIITWLKSNGYTFISCDQLIDIINKKMACPRGAVYISLDDGWKGNLDNVIPIAVDYDVPITIFIYTSAVEDGRFWWERVRECANLLPPAYRSVKAIRQLPEDMKKQILQIITQAESEESFRREAMTVEDIRRISQIPQVTIGSHTVTHPDLPNCDDHRIDYELGESKKILKDWTGKPVRTFSYPFGRFDGRERQFLQKYQYELATTTENKSARSNTDCYLLPRTDVMDDGSFSENLCHLLGIWQLVASKVKHVIQPGG